MKNQRLLIILAVLVGIILAAVVFGSPKPKAKTEVATDTIQSACGPYRSDRLVRIGSTNINTEVPKNSAEFEKGLGGRPCILPTQGMLFAFTKPGQYPFWMKGMKFPIDIIWISSSHKVAAIEIDESPKTYPDKFANKIPAQFVLELKANLSKELGLNLGSTVNF